MYSFTNEYTTNLCTIVIVFAINLENLLIIEYC